MNSTRMLILDYALSPPAIHEGIAFYFRNAGCTVEYRQYYPNLVREDLKEYGIIALLAGRGPAYPGGVMSLAEVGVAAEFVRSGGTLILGPNLEGGEGANERYLFNRVLANLGAAIRICNQQVEDVVNGYQGTLRELPLFQAVKGHPVNKAVASRLAFDRSVALVAGEGTSVLLQAFKTAEPSGAPVMAMAQVGKGCVLVAGRHLLNATGIPLRISGEPLVHPEWLRDTSVYLQNMAEYVVGVMEGRVAWVDVNPAKDAEIGPVGPADFDLDRSPVLDRLLDGVHVEVLKPPVDAPDAYDRDQAAGYEQLPDARLYGWVREEGVRASWGSTVDWAADVKSKADVERIAGALKDCGMNMFWGISNCQAIGGPGYAEEEQARVRQQWEWTAAALEGSGVRWFPTLDYRYFREEQTRCYGAQGQKLDAPSPMDMAFWEENWAASLEAIATFSVDHPCVGGIAVDMELYAHPPAYNYYTGYGFEDLCYFTVLERWNGRLDRELLREASSVQLPDRFNWLRTHGWLEIYFNVLSAEVERVCREIRELVWRINPDLLFASYIFTTPCNWFDLGVYRGFSTPERPLILMTFNVRSGRMLEYLRRERVYAYHASVALLGTIRKEEYETVFGNARKYGHGYWMNNINALLQENSESVESPARKEMSAEEAVAAIRAANEKVASVQL